MTCTELVIHPASEALLADNSLGNKPLGMIGAAPGCLDIHFGIAVEDKKTVYVAIDWETIDHHRALTKSPGYDELKDSFKELGGPLSVQHVHFNAPIENAFSAPITEIATLTLKDGQSKDDLEAHLTKLKAGADTFSPKYAPSAVGESVEKPGTFFLVVGWDSVEAHTEAVKGSEAGPLVKTLLELAGGEAKHVPLKKFSRT